MKFETFIPLKSNIEAFDKARNKSTEILQSYGNKGEIQNIEPLLICSEIPGLGKTHLLQATKSKLNKLNVVSTYAHRLLSVFSELNDPKEALNEKLKAGNSKNSDKVKYLLGDSYSVKKRLQRNVTNQCEYLESGDILLIEDIQFLTGCSWDKPIQEAVYSSFVDVVNSYYLAGKPIIATISEGESYRVLKPVLDKISYLDENKVVIHQLDFQDKLVVLQKKLERIKRHQPANKKLIEFAKQDFNDMWSIECFVMRLMIERRSKHQMTEFNSAGINSAPIKICSNVIKK